MVILTAKNNVMVMITEKKMGAEGGVGEAHKWKQNINEHHKERLNKKRQRKKPN